MSKVKCGLIQMALKGDGSMQPDEIRDRMIEAHIPYIEDAGKAGCAGFVFPGSIYATLFLPEPGSKVVRRRGKNS